MVQKVEILIDWLITEKEKYLVNESKRRFHKPQKCAYCLQLSNSIAELRQMRQMFFEAEKQEEEEMYKQIEEQKKKEEQEQFEEWKRSQQQNPKITIVKGGQK